MSFLVAVDDTDMPGTTGTGRLLQELCGILKTSGWCVSSPISRHQLFVHDDIPFTSHNSAMCVEIDLINVEIESFVFFMARYLEEQSARGSDPGLCIAELDGSLDTSLLIEFGKRAKSEIVSKAEAYDIAQKTGIHLSEHGGTGLGVIGAVAGMGLSLTGNDGRYRGWYALGKPGDIIPAGSIRAHGFDGQVMTLTGEVLDPAEPLMVGSEKTKAVRINSQPVILTCGCNGHGGGGNARFRTLTSQEAKAY
ncbi:MAG TPA: hypothetical protein DDY20_12845 [Desulfobulbaceae bacterium]|nr:hypothetical protein [Desulfobulbaceae bacterium]